MARKEKTSKQRMKLEAKQEMMEVRKLQEIARKLPANSMGTARALAIEIGGDGMRPDSPTGYSADEGFAVFFDYVVGMPTKAVQSTLVYGLYEGANPRMPPKGLPQRCQDTRGTTESNNAGHAEGTSVAGSPSPAAAVECANPVGTEVEAWCAQRGRWRRAVVVATRHGELKLKFLGEGNAVRSAPLEARVMELESALAAEQGARLDAEGELARISGRAMPPRSVQVLSKSHQWRNCSVIAARRDPEAIRVHYEGFSEIFVSEPFLNFSASRTCLSRSVFLPRISRATNCRMSG